MPKRGAPDKGPLTCTSGWHQVGQEPALPSALRGLRGLVAPMLAGLAAFALYARTLPSGLTWAHSGADGGDLLAAALTGGVPHPTGYPTYQLLLRFTLAVSGGNPAHAGALLSAICAALAVALLTDLVQRAVPHGQKGHSMAASIAAFVSGLTWAASPVLWSQAVIVEVYALNALICAALLWLAWRWAQAVEGGSRGEAWVVAAGLVFGLGLGNHLTAALMLPGLAVWLRFAVRSKGLQASFWRYLALAALASLAGLLVYLYLPLAAQRDPPVNWGDPTSLATLLWVVTGRPYAGLAFGLPIVDLPQRLLGWATSIVQQFQPWGFVLALAGLWRLGRMSRPWWLATLLTWLAFTIYALGYDSTDSVAYLIPSYAVMALWLAELLYAGFVWVERWRGGQAALLMFILAALPAASVAANYQLEDLSRDREAEEFVASAAREAENNAVILTAGDKRTFALWYAVYGLHARPDVAILNVNLYGYEWYRRTLAQTHGNLLPSDGGERSIESLVAGLVARRPVYKTEDLDLSFPGLTQHRLGVLARLSQE